MVKRTRLDTKRRWSKPLRQAAAAMALSGLAACSLLPGRVEPPVPGPEGRVLQTGIASWYGPGFHGQPTASGAVYNQHDLTAAHQTLPLGTRVMVTNLHNGRSIEVLINDRGPFAKGRIIDLSYAAARAIDMIGPGTAPVRVEVIEAPYKIQQIRASLDYTLQLGSFAQLENAELLRDRLKRSHSEVDILPLQSSTKIYYRVRLGTYTSRAAAEEQAKQFARNGYSVIIMEK